MVQLAVALFTTVLTAGCLTAALLLESNAEPYQRAYERIVRCIRWAFIRC